MKKYFQPEIETMPVEQLKALQSERLVEQVKFVYDNVEFYRGKMDEAGVKPEALLRQRRVLQAEVRRGGREARRHQERR